MRRLRQWWRRWSPWTLRKELGFVRSVLADERATHDGYVSTLVERLFRHITYVLLGHPDPWGEAERYRVEGTTLYVDARPIEGPPKP